MIRLIPQHRTRTPFAESVRSRHDTARMITADFSQETFALSQRNPSEAVMLQMCCFIGVSYEVSNFFNLCTWYCEDM